MAFAIAPNARLLSYFALAFVCVFLLFSKDCIEQSFQLSPTAHTVSANTQLSIDNSTLGVRYLFLSLEKVKKL